MRLTQTAILFWIIVLVGSALRIAPLFHDFSLDEAWSYLLVREVVSAPTDIFTKMHIDNNHPLNSLTLYLMGNCDWPFYRIPAWISGVCCIPLTYMVMRRFGKPHAFSSMALVAFSYPLIVYCTEARGYGTLLCFLLVAIESSQRWLVNRSHLACGLFWVVVILGAISHLTFISGYIAILVSSIEVLRHSRKCIVDGLTDFVKCHAVPLLFLAVLYWFFIRHLRSAGSAPMSVTNLLTETIRIVLGGPESGPFAQISVLLFFLLLLRGWHRTGIRSDGWQLLFVWGIILVPLALAALHFCFGPVTTSLYPRYFLTSILLFLLLVGFVLGDLYQHARWGKAIGATLLVLILTGNLVEIARFTSIGRGHYLQALKYILKESPDEQIHVASNSSFRTAQLISFYRQYLPKEREIVYHPRLDADHPQQIDWWIDEFLDAKEHPPQKLDTAIGHFTLGRYFEFYGPSGCGWVVYRRSRHTE